MYIEVRKRDKGGQAWVSGALSPVYVRYSNKSSNFCKGEQQIAGWKDRNFLSVLNLVCLAVGMLT